MSFIKNFVLKFKSHLITIGTGIVILISIFNLGKYLGKNKEKQEQATNTIKNVVKAKGASKASKKSKLGDDKYFIKTKKK